MFLWDGSRLRMREAFARTWALSPHNKGLQLTKAARCAPFAHRSWGQSLRAAFAAEARCSTHRMAPTFPDSHSSITASLTAGASSSSGWRGFYGGSIVAAPKSRGGGKGSPWSGIKEASWLRGTLGPIGLVQNNALQLTRREGAAGALRCRPVVVESRLAAERECWAGIEP